MRKKIKFAFAIFVVGALAACGPQKPPKQDGADQTQQQQMSNDGERPHRPGKLLREGCAQELQTYCQAADRPAKCLRQHMDVLGNSCKQALEERKARRLERKREKMNGNQPAGSTTPTQPSNNDDDD